MMDISIKDIENGYLLTYERKDYEYVTLYFPSIHAICDYILANYNIDPHTPTPSAE